MAEGYQILGVLLSRSSIKVKVKVCVYTCVWLCNLNHEKIKLFECIIIDLVCKYYRICFMHIGSNGIQFDVWRRVNYTDS